MAGLRAPDKKRLDRIDSLSVDKQLAEEASGTKRIRRVKRMQRNRFFRLWEKLAQRHDTLAQLVFNPGTTDRTARQLDALLTGILSFFYTMPNSGFPYTSRYYLCDRRWGDFWRRTLLFTSVTN